MLLKLKKKFKIKSRHQKSFRSWGCGDAGTSDIVPDCLGSNPRYCKPIISFLFAEMTSNMVLSRNDIGFGLPKLHWNGSRNSILRLVKTICLERAHHRGEKNPVINTCLVTNVYKKSRVLPIKKLHQR